MVQLFWPVLQSTRLQLLLHKASTESKGMNLQSARVLGMKIPMYNVQMLFSDLGTIWELVFVHCTVFLLNAMQVAVVPAGPSLLPLPGWAGSASGIHVLTLCGRYFNTSSMVCSLRDWGVLCLSSEGNLMYSGFLKSDSSSFKLAN